MAYAEVYTGLQTGAIDGQDNPLPNVENMKFYEVMSQIVLTSHLVGFDLLTINLKLWEDMSPAQQTAFQAAADKAIDWSTKEHLAREAELVEELQGAGPQDLRAGRRRLPRPCPEGVPGIGPGQELAGRECSTRSTRSDSSTAIAERRRHPAGATHGRDSASALAARRAENVAGGDARRDVRRLHPPDRLPLRPQLPDRLDVRAERHHVALDGACGAPPSWSARRRRSAST